MHADLHTHTSMSDGSLSPDELVTTAIENGVELLSITDHDTVAAYYALNEPIQHWPHSLGLIRGVEFSTSWAGIGIHVVALNVDLESDALVEAIAVQSGARQQRAELIAEKLYKRIGHDLLPAARALAGDGVIGRPHFAQAMIDSGLAADWQQVFSRYLGRGKPGDVKTTWASLDQIIAWTRAAGGVAVLAHPLHYKLTNSKLGRLLDAFVTAGGRAMEVVSGSQTVDRTNYLARLCQARGLLASCGSDFHHPAQWSAPGQVAPLPAGCKPVWESWG